MERLACSANCHTESTLKFNFIQSRGKEHQITQVKTQPWDLNLYSNIIHAKRTSPY